jgi:hypothetical protein
VLWNALTSGKPVALGGLVVTSLVPPAMYESPNALTATADVVLKLPPGT